MNFIAKGNFAPRTIYNVRKQSRIFINPELQECDLFLSRYYFNTQVSYLIYCFSCFSCYFNPQFHNVYRFLDGPGDDYDDSDLSWYSDGSMQSIEHDILSSTSVSNLRALDNPSSDVSFSCLSFFLSYVFFLTNYCLFLQVKFCVSLGVIVSVESKKGWYYNSCPGCTNKVIHDDRGFYCISCGHMLLSVIPKFKVEFEVSDDSICSTFLLFDREVAALVNCSAADIVKDLVSVCIKFSYKS